MQKLCETEDGCPTRSVELFPTKPSAAWRCRDRVLDLAAKTWIMGILNVTPDSFSDGGCYLEPDQALSHARRMLSEGADIIDVGGESSRPGATGVDEDEEMRRVIPVIERLAAETDALISVDTTKAGVACRALEVGAAIVNDISALTFDERMAEASAEYGAGVILMHMLGEPCTMQKNPCYADVVRDVRDYLAGRLNAVMCQGLALERVVLDPGIGFGKTMEHNLDLLRGIPALLELGRPVLIGASRKSFIGKLLDRAINDRLAGSLAAMAYGIQRGARIFRVHDVKASRDVALLLDRLNGLAKPAGKVDA